MLSGPCPMICAMKLSTNPAVWRVALLAIVAAAAQVGLLTPALGEQVNGGITAMASALTILLPVIGAIWSKTRTAPVAAGTEPVKILVRGGDGVYTAASQVGEHERADGL